MCLKVCRDLYTYATDEPADGDLAPGYASCNAMKKTLNCTIADSSCAVRSDVAAGAAGRSGCHPFRQQQACLPTPSQGGDHPPPPPPPTHPHNYFGDRQEANAGSAIVTVPADPIISCAAWLSWMLQSYQGEAMQ